jgi:hypothetical protein
MRKLILIAFLITAPAGATDVYRWVDSNGQAHYSDQWQPGAEKMRIESSAVVNGAKAPPGADGVSGPAPATEPDKAAGRYESLEITSPAQEEVLWNIEGQLRVSLRLSPPLQPGHDLRLYLDGTLQDLPAGSTEAQLKDVYRGIHTVKAEVVNASGTVLISSQPTTFVVRQTSIQNPSRPGAP